MLPIKHFVIGCNAGPEYSMIYTPRIQSIFPELPCVGLSYFFKIQQKSQNTVYSLKLCLCFANRQHSCIISCIVLIDKRVRSGQPYLLSKRSYLCQSYLLSYLIIYWLGAILTVLALDRNCHIVKEYVKEFQLTAKIFWHFLPKICNSVQRLVRWQSFLILPDENILLQIIVLKFWRWTAKKKNCKKASVDPLPLRLA